jgi:hypothetical protein
MNIFFDKGGRYNTDLHNRSTEIYFFHLLLPIIATKSAVIYVTEEQTF